MMLYYLTLLWAIVLMTMVGVWLYDESRMP